MIFSSVVIPNILWVFIESYWSFPCFIASRIKFASSTNLEASEHTIDKWALPSLKILSIYPTVAWGLA